MSCGTKKISMRRQASTLRIQLGNQNGVVFLYKLLEQAPLGCEEAHSIPVSGDRTYGYIKRAKYSK